MHLIPWTETEKELRVSPELRQVRLDVIGMDEFGEVYQMEMQQATQRVMQREDWKFWKIWFVMGWFLFFEAAERMGMSVEEFQNDNNQRIEVESPEINR
mgnify:CR=1 FL=1